MLETIRQYANESLVDLDENNSLCDKHSDYFLDLAETAEPYLVRSEQLEWLARLDADYENLRAALEWALRKKSGELSLRLCAALGRYWYLRTYWLEGSKWLKSALSKTVQNLTEVEKAAREKVLYQDAVLADELDDLERMKTSAEQSFILAQEVSNKKDIAIARFEVARVLYRRLDYENAFPLFEQSYAEFRELHDAYWEAYSYRWASRILVAQGKLSEAERNLQNLALARKAGERLNLADALVGYAHSLYSSNQIDEAQKYVQEADLLFKQISPNINQTSFLFAELAWSKGDYEEAKRHYMEMQERFGLIGEKNLRSHMIANLGLLTMEQGNLDQAQAYLEQALATAHEIDNKVFIARRLAALGTTYYLQGNIERCRQSFRECIPILKELPSGPERNTLLLIVNYIDIPKQEIIASLLGAINHSERESEGPMSPLNRRYYNRAKMQAREKLGIEAFESAFADGQKMSRGEALDLALKTMVEM
jgi:tetratricopeptide (TPR) repeat protein